MCWFRKQKQKNKTFKSGRAEILPFIYFIIYINSQIDEKYRRYPLVQNVVVVPLLSSYLNRS